MFESLFEGLIQRSIVCVNVLQMFSFKKFLLCGLVRRTLFFVFSFIVARTGEIVLPPTIESTSHSPTAVRVFPSDAFHNDPDSFAFDGPFAL